VREPPLHQPGEDQHAVSRSRAHDRSPRPAVCRVPDRHAHQPAAQAAQMDAGVGRHAAWCANWKPIRTSAFSVRIPSLGTTIMLQYWDSFEKFESYARAKDHAYLPAWRDFNRRVGTSGDVGVWHETYLVQPGGFEAIYSNMPPFGSPSLPPPSLRKAGASMRATGCAANPTRRIDGLLAQHVACVPRTPHWSSASCGAGRSALCEVRCRTRDVGAEQCC
jgi:hypothetical protein